jgi:hypothetical protein
MATASARTDTAPQLDPRAMMRAELVKLRAPLGMLTALSRCLTDKSEDLEIRDSVTALLCRAEALTEQITACEARCAHSSSFDVGDHVRGST